MFLHKNHMDSETKNGQGGESKDGLAGEHGGPKNQLSFSLSLSRYETTKMHVSLKNYLSLCVKVILQAIFILIFTTDLRVNPKFIPVAPYSRPVSSASSPECHGNSSVLIIALWFALPARWLVIYLGTASFVEY